MELILLRHSSTKGNLLRRYIGTTDEALCPEGIVVAREKAKLYPKVDIVYASPLRRCGQTADIMFPGVSHIVIDGLRETNFGRFENKSYEDLKDEPEYQKWIDSGGTTAFPDGESRDMAGARTLGAFDDMLRDLHSRTIKRAAAVVHGGTIMAIMSDRATPKRDFYAWQVKNCEGFLLHVGEENKTLTMIEEYRQ